MKKELTVLDLLKNGMESLEQERSYYYSRVLNVIMKYSEELLKVKTEDISCIKIAFDDIIEASIRIANANKVLVGSKEHPLYNQMQEQFESSIKSLNLYITCYKKKLNYL